MNRSLHRNTSVDNLGSQDKSSQEPSLNLSKQKQSELYVEVKVKLTATNYSSPQTHNYDL